MLLHTIILAAFFTIYAMAQSANYTQLITDLPIASRILAYQGVVDAFGHISARNPDNASTFIMSRNIAPALVTQQDLVTYNVDDASPTNVSAPRGFLERHIHASIYKAHPEVNSVVHFHASAVLPFGVLGAHIAPYKAIYHMAAFLSSTPAPIFDIAEHFGDSTDILITDAAKGDALAIKFSEPGGLGGVGRTVVLMRGHGATLVAENLRTAVFRAVYAVTNAEIELEALKFGGASAVRFLSPGECVAATASIGGQADRPWGLWSSQVQLSSQ